MEREGTYPPGRSLTEEVLAESSEKDDANAMAAHVCELIDKAIAQGYKIYPTNRIAYDLLHGTYDTHGTDIATAAHPASTPGYTPAEKAAFMEHLDKLRFGTVPLIPDTALAAAIPFDKNFPGGDIETSFRQQIQYIQKYFDLIRNLLGIYANRARGSDPVRHPVCRAVRHMDGGTRVRWMIFVTFCRVTLYRP